MHFGAKLVLGFLVSLSLVSCSEKYTEDDFYEKEGLLYLKLNDTVFSGKLHKDNLDVIKGKTNFTYQDGKLFTYQKYDQNGTIDSEYEKPIRTVYMDGVLWGRFSDKDLEIVTSTFYFENTEMVQEYRELNTSTNQQTTKRYYYPNGQLGRVSVSIIGGDDIYEKRYHYDEKLGAGDVGILEKHTTYEHDKKLQLVKYYDEQGKFDREEKYRMKSFYTSTGSPGISYELIEENK